MSYFASLLRRLRGALHGDDRATDPARVLRVPGTLNHKYDYPRTVTLITTADTMINLSDLDEVLPREVIVRNPEQAELEFTAKELIATLRKDPAAWPLNIKVAYAQAESLGIPEKTLRTAARRAGLTTFSKGFGKQRTDYWFDPLHAVSGNGSREVS